MRTCGRRIPLLAPPRIASVAASPSTAEPSSTRPTPTSLAAAPSVAGASEVSVEAPRATWPGAGSEAAVVASEGGACDVLPKHALSDSKKERGAAAARRRWGGRWAYVRLNSGRLCREPNRQRGRPPPPITNGHIWNAVSQKGVDQSSPKRPNSCLHARRRQASPRDRRNPSARITNESGQHAAVAERPGTRTLSHASARPALRLNARAARRRGSHRDCELGRRRRRGAQPRRRGGRRRHWFVVAWLVKRVD